MNHFLAPSPRGGDVNRHFVHGSKLIPSTDGCLPSHVCPPPNHRYTPDFESESDGETSGSCTTPDPHTITPPVIVTSADGEEPVLKSLDHRPGPSPRVRFRSRVRISAGRHRRRSHGSAASGSPSSSISAPLRTHYTGNKGWGPLGTRVSNQKLRTAPNPLRREDFDANIVKGTGIGDGDWDAWEQYTRPTEIVADEDVNEHTHLMTPMTGSFYARNRYVSGSYHDDGEQELRWREQLVDEVFGEWPARLLNRHWWWWHLEPILCCLCYPDDEE